MTYDTTIPDLAEKMSYIIKFKYMTVDRLSVKFWTDKPTWNGRSKCWGNAECVGMLDLIGKLNLEEYRDKGKSINYSTILIERKGNGFSSKRLDEFRNIPVYPKFSKKKNLNAFPEDAPLCEDDKGRLAFVSEEAKAEFIERIEGDKRICWYT